QGNEIGVRVLRRRCFNRYCLLRRTIRAGSRRTLHNYVWIRVRSVNARTREIPRADGEKHRSGGGERRPFKPAQARATLAMLLALEAATMLAKRGDKRGFEMRRSAKVGRVLSNSFKSAGEQLRLGKARGATF